MNNEDKHFIERYEELLNKGYCNCNEMNCIDNNSPRRILDIVKQLQSNWNSLRELIEDEKTRLATECSHTYEDSLGKTKYVNEDIYNELDKILDKMNELEGNKDG